ncbi:MAG: ABC transporter ATP-binding protein [Bacteroidetes bacterium]|nr:ABC transporter ATP-binding protein [Bacteroidota bacterium]
MLKLLKNLKPYTLSIILISLLTFARAISELFLPTLMADIVDVGIVTGDIPYIWKTGLIMLIVTAGGIVCAITARFFSSKAGVGFSRDVRKKVFHRVESFSLNEFDEIGTSSMITRTTNDINQVQQAVVLMLSMMIYAPMMAIGGIIMAISKDPPLSMVLVVIVPVIVLVVIVVASKGLPLFKQIQIKIDGLNMVLRESLIGVRVIRAFNKTAHEKTRFDKASRDLADTSIKVNKLMAVMMPIMMLLFNFTTIAIIWFGGIRIDNGAMQIGDLMAFIQYIMRIMFALMMLIMMFIMIPRAAVSAVRINKILEKDSDIKDPEHPKSSSGQTGRIEYRNVSFRYHGAEEPAVRNISFIAEPGEVTAIIGGTGSGKSTLINLLPRFYDVHSGSILVNGVDIREMSQEDLRDKIGLVPQKSVLFSGTVADNIRFGARKASIEEVEHAADIAQAGSFVGEMENGYESEISQGGTNVSGGQKQRLAIARAVAKRPEIYLFDDSFSALDFKTDAALRRALKDETQKAAVLIISQRVSTVMHADNIIVMDDGRIEAQGTHYELLQTCSIYNEIANSQLAGEEPA